VREEHFYHIDFTEIATMVNPSTTEHGDKGNVIFSFFSSFHGFIPHFQILKVKRKVFWLAFVLLV
jgi:hypothetical protein